MTLPLNSRLSALYDTNGTQKDFSFGFRVFFDPDNGGYGLEVRRQTADGYEVIPKSDYLVLPVEDNSAGVVRFSVAPSAGQQIYIAGKTPTIQQLVLTNFGRYSAESIETQFDFITAIIQEWLSALGEETRQRIANDEIAKEYADEKFLEFQGWVYDQFPDYARSAFDEIFEDFYSQWIDALNKLNKENLQAENVFDGDENQHQINKSLIRTYNSVSDLLSIPNPQHGQVAFVRHYDLEQGILDGGGIFVYQNTNQLINDRGYIFNGWTRKLERPIFTPEMFGAKGDLTRDDAPSIRAATTSAYANNIKSILFSKKYLIDTPENVGEESLIRIYPRCSYIGIGGAEIVVGDNIPDKFHILAAAFFESLQPDAKSVLMDGIKFRALSTATNMDSYATNMAIHTFGLSDVCIQNCIFDDLDTANVIATGIHWQGVTYGARVTIQNNRFLDVVAESLNNTDHSSLYILTPDSFVLNNLFKATTMQTAKIGCAVEVHSSNTLVANNQIYGYSRGAWLASFPNNLTNSHVINNIAHVSNHLVIVSNAATQAVSDCRIFGNKVRCSHAFVSPVQGEVPFNGWQGLLVADGQLDPAGWMPSDGIVVEKNIVHFDHSINPKFATLVYADQRLGVSCHDNVAHDALGGAVFYHGNDAAFSGNEFYNRTNTSTHKKDLFIEYITNHVSNLTIENNKFYFTIANAPAYLIGLPYVADYDVSSIYENKVFAPAKITGDLFYPNTLNISKYGNTVDFNFYKASVDFPAMTAGQEYVITVQLPNNANFCIAEAILLPDSRFYPLTTKGIVSGTASTIRVKATATAEAFSVDGVTMRVRTT